MKTYKLVVVGAGGTGKSSITVQFVQGQFLEKYDPTIEDSYRKQIEHNGEAVMLEILDTAGQEELSAMRDVYVKTGQGFIMVYSITSATSFSDLEDIRKQITRAKDSEEVPTILVGNKVDLADEREVATVQGQDLVKTWPMAQFLETSAKTKVNIPEVFHTLLDLIEKKAGGAETKQKKKTCNLL